MNILECSSKGDKRFSAFYALVEFNGYRDSIENIYQSVKRDVNGNKVKKGAFVNYVVINNKKERVEILTPFYTLLWVKYFNNNKELLNVIREYDDYNDMFKGRSLNCQADVIRNISKNGLKKVYEDALAEFNKIGGRL